MNESADPSQDARSHAAAPTPNIPSRSTPYGEETRGIQNTHNDGRESRISTFSAMFPEMDRSTIGSVLDDHGGDPNAVVTVLLSMNDNEYRPTQQDQHVVQNAKFSRQGGDMYRDSHPPTQSWDPRKLTYQPRIRRNKTSANVTTYPTMPQRESTAQSANLPDMRDYEARLANAASDGMAMMASKLSQLRKRAESTWRNMPEGGMKQRIQGSSLFRRTQPSVPDRHEWSRSQLNSMMSEQDVKYGYDKDPQLVCEWDLDQILSNPLPKPRKAPEQSWGKRYTDTPSTSRTSQVHEGELAGWDAVGRESDADDEVPADTGAAKHEVKKSNTKEPAQKLETLTQATESTESKNRANGGTKTTESPLPQKQAVESDSEREYINNPFEDDD